MVETIEPEGPQIREGAEEPAATPLEPTTNTAPANAPMQEAADNLITNYFAKVADQMFQKINREGNWQINTPFKDHAEDFGVLMASIVTCVPTQKTGNDWISVIYSVNGTKEDFVPFLVKAFGEYALQVDTFQDDSLLSDFDRMANFSPFLGKVKQTFSDREFKGYSPLSFALSMEKKYRHPFILALDKQSKIDDFAPFHTNPNNIQQTKYVSQFPALIEVFKEYQLTQLNPVLAEIERVKQLYKEAWNI
jgi:hypothetical protein